MNEKLKEKIKESLTSVLPITVIVLLISITLVPLEVGTLLLFLTGAFLLIVGMGFFQLGAEMAMMPLGQGVGGKLVKSKSIWLIGVVCFLMGAIITVSEPDLQVLANQVAAIPNKVLIWTVAVGVGAFMVLAVLRILFKISLLKMLTVFYAALFVLTLFSPTEFIAVAFDSGGVASGPMTSTFLLPLAMGACTALGGNVVTDAFGVVALVALAPLIAIQIMGYVFAHKSKAGAVPAEALPEDAVPDEIVLELDELDEED